MVDRLTPRQRSALMARVRGRGNRSTELRLIALFRAEGITGWRRGAKLPGKPDFVFRRQYLAVFVDGCFWHGCPRHSALPQSHHDYWRAKIARNRRRDRAVARLLRAAGWRVLRLWEHDLGRVRSARAIARLHGALA